MEKYDKPADFSIYDTCVKTGKDIIANGDIKTKEQISFLKDIGVKGVMIGRSAVISPSIFNMLQDKKSPSLENIKNELVISSFFD